MSYISFLHQTTTHVLAVIHPAQLSYISFLHQTTTVVVLCAVLLDCLISLFYIKPQLSCSNSRCHPIVLYLFSTPNHNSLTRTPCGLAIVLYLFSTSNHNTRLPFSVPTTLSYISFLHQTTTHCKVHSNWYNCLISLFYIKPQRYLVHSMFY